MARSLWCAASLAGVIAMAAPLGADTKNINSVQGLITGSDGKPLVHAVVRAMRTDATGKDAATTTTDKDGHYLFTALPAGKYSITVVPERGNQQAFSATANVSAGTGQPVRRFISPLPYQVKADYHKGTPGNVRKNYVWQPGETGTHIGGRWVPAGDASRPSSNPIQVLGTVDFGQAPAVQVNSSPIR